MYKWFKDKFQGEMVFDTNLDSQPGETPVGVSVRKYGNKYSIIIHSPGKVAGEHFVIVEPDIVNRLIEKLNEAKEAVVIDMAPKFGKRI
jgi:hypothetical protein